MPDQYKQYTDEAYQDQPWTLDQAISQFDAINREIKKLQERKFFFGSIIAETSIKGTVGSTSNTSRVTSSNGIQLKIERKFKTEWDADQLLTARELLGRDQFDQLFKTKIEFAPQLKNLKKFLTTSTSDERIESGKKIIGDAKIESEQTPYITVEKSYTDVIKERVAEKTFPADQADELKNLLGNDSITPTPKEDIEKG